MFKQSRNVAMLVFLVCLTANALCVQNVIVYEEEGVFCGWPANEGIWSWGDEIVVGFNMGEYVEDDPGHDCNLDGRIERVQARSTDGGETWSLEKPQAIKRGQKPQELQESINFTHPNFALKCRNDKFWYSYDRAKEWEGPFLFPEFGCITMKSRTDYIVEGEKECLIFLSSDKPDGIEGAVFCVRTQDGGKTFDFLSWVGDMPPMLRGSGYFCVQPSTVKLSDKTYLCSVRQRRNRRKWIDCFISTDDCQSWQLLSMPVPPSAWNPPSVIQLKDDRLCLTYGRRGKPEGIRALFSNDGGKTWSKEYSLRDDGREWDLGYVRSVQRTDGKVVSVYYYTTEAKKRQHIAATIWDPKEYE